MTKYRFTFHKGVDPHVYVLDGDIGYKIDTDNQILPLTRTHVEWSIKFLTERFLSGESNVAGIEQFDD